MSARGRWKAVCTITWGRMEAPLGCSVVPASSWQPQLGWPAEPEPVNTYCMRHVWEGSSG